MPGVIGALVTSLVILRVFQLPVINRLYDTLLPSLLALVLFLLPRALLCRISLHSFERNEGLQLTRLMGSTATLHQRRQAHEIEWRLRRRGPVLMVLLLTWFGYWCLTPLAILGPGHLTFLPVRLCNLMHYGRSETLTAMCAMAVVVPVAAATVLVLANRMLFVRPSRS